MVNVIEYTSWTDLHQTTYVTNGEVAWMIPRGIITIMYNLGYYEPPPGWQVVHKLEGHWRIGNCGELRLTPCQEPAGVV